MTDKETEALRDTLSPEQIDKLDEALAGRRDALRTGAQGELVK
jgi:hypothetical protein